MFLCALVINIPWWDKPYNCDNQEHVNPVNLSSCVYGVSMGEMAWTRLTFALRVPQLLDVKNQTERNQEAVSTEDHRGRTLWPERGSGIRAGGNENDRERERRCVVSCGVSSAAGSCFPSWSTLPPLLPPSPPIYPPSRQKATSLKHSLGVIVPVFLRVYFMLYLYCQPRL